MDGAVTSDAISAVFAAQRVKVAERRLNFGYTERREALKKFADAVRRYEPEILVAFAVDFGKPEAEVVFTEILPVTQEIRHTLKHLRRWMRPSRVSSSLPTFGTSAQVMAQPRGVCLIISPWNYPLNLCLGPLVSCLAAGNSAMLKPSEMTPAVSAVIARLIAETFPPDLVTVVEGGKDVSTALLALPFDHIFFTGSPAVGRIVMEAAAKNLASVTLELGGKSPAIVGPDADIEQAAKWIAFGKFVNAGQTCIAPDYLFVHASIKERLLALLRERIAKAYGDGAQSPHLARIVNDHHARRLSGLLDDAKAKGARVVSGGEAEARAMAPTLIEAITPEMEIDREEIFGPILPVIAFDDIEQVIAQINARPKPLSLYIFDRNSTFVDRVLASTTSGGAGVNLTMLHFTHPDLPFGGVNNSGIGMAHGHYGFLAFSHQRAVLRNRFSPVPLVFPPYEGRTKRIIDLAKRFLG